MPRKGENIYKRKDGRWEGRYIKSHNGAKALYGYIYGRSYQEVKEKLIEVKADYQQNKSREIKMPLPFSTYLGLWLSEKEQTIKHSTYIKYTNLLEGYIHPNIGDSYVEKLGYDEISVFCLNLLQTGGKKKTGLSQKMVADCLTIVKSVIRFAARKKCNIDSSALEVSIKLRNRPLRVLTLNEQELLLKYLRGNPTPINIGILIGLFTGIRIGELCALK